MSRSRSVRVHPRVCGEASPSLDQTFSLVGPSPRVRGSRCPAPSCWRARGSIPACAGKPSPPCHERCSLRVHPRVCGEARSKPSSVSRVMGPSPRVRGSPRGTGGGPGCSGSIPACAGKPSPADAAPTAAWVHPRVCGEALKAKADAEMEAGPSPRVRGSHDEQAGDHRGTGSIPACAGKPQAELGGVGVGRVHPRVCGEALTKRASRMHRYGPSPRVRGSLVKSHSDLHNAGSIPACAGKPASDSTTAVSSGVHPRVCGEAVSGKRRRDPSGGPSPRVRGSPHLP